MDRHVDARDLIAQETVASATKGLLWASAIQAFSAVFSVLFLAITVGLLYWSGTQIQKANRFGESMARSGIRAARSGNRAAISAKMTLEETKKNNTLQLRPYLEIPKVKIIRRSNMSNTMHLDISFDIKNVGLSPATDFTDAWLGHSDMTLLCGGERADYDLVFVGNSASGTVWRSLNSAQTVTYNKTLLFESATPHTVQHMSDSDILDMTHFELESSSIEVIFTFSDTLEGNTRYQRVVFNYKSSINGGIVIAGKTGGFEIWATELSPENGESMLRNYQEMDKDRESPELYPVDDDLRGPIGEDPENSVK